MSIELDTLKVIQAIRKTQNVMDKNPPLAYTRVIYSRVIDELGRRIMVSNITQRDEELIPNKLDRLVIHSGDFEVMIVYMNNSGFKDEATMLLEIIRTP